jgi:hypothetical protein
VAAEAKAKVKAKQEEKRIDKRQSVASLFAPQARKQQKVAAIVENFPDPEDSTATVSLTDSMMAAASRAGQMAEEPEEDSDR